MLRTLYEKILVQIPTKQETTTKNGLVFQTDMSNNSNRVMEGTVKSVGEGRLLEDGTILPLKVKVDDKVLFTKMSGEEYTDEDGVTYIILSESNILAIKETE